MDISGIHLLSSWRRSRAFLDRFGPGQALVHGDGEATPCRHAGVASGLLIRLAAASTLAIGANPDRMKPKSRTPRVPHLRAEFDMSFKVVPQCRAVKPDLRDRL